MEQDTKNIICLLLNVLLLPGLGTIIHGESKRGLTQIAVLLVVVVVVFTIGVVMPPIESASVLVSAILIGYLIAFLVWLWALLDGIAFVQNREFYVFKNLK